MLLLSRVYEQLHASGDTAAADIVKEISPNAWQHVHLIGAFDFEQAGSGIDIDIDALASRYNDPAFFSGFRVHFQGGVPLPETTYRLP